MNTLTTTPIDRVVAALQSAGCDPRQRGDKWEARCPAHDDHTPSLSLATGNDGRALLKCQAGCDLAAVLDALKLPMADLFVERQTDDRPKITSTYPYTDENGTTLFEVVRFVPKDFRQRTPDGSGGWTWKLNGVRRVPYRLPELLTAAKCAGTPVFITEGEKDADAIVRTGQVATCSPGGAGKWRPEYADHFAGVPEVVIVADRDTPGYRHARDVARSLTPVVDLVRLCGPAKGNDVTDHLVAGLSLDELDVIELAELEQLCADQPKPPVSEPDHEGDEQGVAPDGLRVTDAGHAQRFITLTNGRVRFVYKWGRWIVYRSGRWIIDTNDALVTEAAKAVPRALMAMVPKLGPDQRDKVYKAALKAESAGSIAAMIRLARGIDGVIVEHEDLDADPFILNCTNGTVDLRTGELRQHDPADLCTQQCPVDYDAEAVAPLWGKCLERWQPNPEVREYLQREAGAGACGRQTETLSIHYGQGGNGKSKHFGALQRALGSYAVVPHKSLIVASRHEQHATVLASLFRARLAVASETSERDWLNESQVKNLTGGDRLSARRMREDEWEFDPTHTLVMFSNHRPEIRGTDEGMWRRVRLIPWDVTIPEAERDEALAAKLADEAPGILRWIVEGCVRYLSVGIGAPDSIVASTASYRAGEDTVGRFLGESGIVFERGCRVSSSELTATHEAWCADAGLNAAGHWRRVAAEMKGQGARTERVHRDRQWVGITIRGSDSEQSASHASHMPVTPREGTNPVSTGEPDACDAPSAGEPLTRTFADGELGVTTTRPTPVLDGLLGPEPARSYQDEPF